MVRPNELSFARRGALVKLADRARGARPGHLVGRLVGLDSEDAHRAIVAFGDSHVSVLSGPHKLVPGALVAVEVDSTNAPTRITGPVTTRPEGLDDDIPAPDAVTTMPELSWADKDTLAQAVADLEDAQVELAKANTLLAALGVAEDEAAITQALADFLDIPPSEVTWSGNLYQTVLARLVVATGIVTETMIATGAITAPKLNVVYTDPESGYGLSLQPEGLMILDADGQPVIVLRADMANFFGIIKDGAYVASIDHDGHITGQTVSANEEFFYQGTELSDVLALDHLPRGLIQRYRSTVQRGYYYVETGVGYLSFLATPGRLYRIKVNALLRISGGTAAYIRAKVRHTGSIGAGWPGNLSVNDPEIDRALVPINALDAYRSGVAEFYWTYPNPDLGAEKPTRILFTIDALSPDAGVQMGTGTEFIIEDVGLIPEGDFGWHMGGSDGGSPPGGGTPTPDPLPPAPPPAKRTRIWSSKSSWTRSFLGNNNFYNYGSGRAYQGLQPRTSNGNLKSMIGFPSTGTTLNGANIKSVEVRIKNGHSYADSGVTAYVGLHGRASAPSTFAFSAGDVVTASFSRGQSRTLTIPSAYHSGFANGDYRGIVLYTSTSSNSRYGHWDGANAELIIQYEK